MIKKLFVESKVEYNSFAEKLKKDIQDEFNIDVEKIRIFSRYYIDNISDELLERAKNSIFADLSIEDVYEKFPCSFRYSNVVVEPILGQYDKRADYIIQCLALLNPNEKPIVRTANVFSFKSIKKDDLDEIKKYIINPLDSKEGTMDIPDDLSLNIPEPHVKDYSGFINLSENELRKLYDKESFAMSFNDLKIVQEYFKSEKRDPKETEIKLFDECWSDHCKHTSFITELKNIKINSENPHIEEAYKMYKELRKEVKKDYKYPCLMDIATIALKKLRAEGKLDNLDISDEVNACSINVDVDVNGKIEPWVVMFKNETCNNPTELEPFGGAATGLSGAILDPLSGRVFVYQAMRISGSADPRHEVVTLKGKLPQRILSESSANGYSSYGNKFGIATGFVRELYHKNYLAKHLESEFVIGAAPKENIYRKTPKAGDVILVLGGKTGNIGCGGATSASKSSDESIEDNLTIQRGNPRIGRCIQRLYKNKEATSLIMKGNDVASGGIAVALMDLTKSFDVNLNLVPHSEEKLTGTQIALSESHERMVVILKEKDVEKFIELANEENIEAVKIATITNTGYVRMFYNGETIVEVKRDVLDSNGEKNVTDVVINEKISTYMKHPREKTRQYYNAGEFKNALLYELSRLNVCSQKGLEERFDSTIGASSIYVPYGGKNQLTPTIAMAAKLPVDGFTNTASVVTFGCSPHLIEDSPFVGTIHSIITSISKQIACGVNIDSIKLTLQEYFKKLGNDANRWGEPVSALLGAFYAQMKLGIGAIGGKDSMSGTYEDIDVPPTVISFACGIANAKQLISNVFMNNEECEKDIYHVPLKRDKYGVPDFGYALKVYKAMNRAIVSKGIKACSVVEEGGVVGAVFKSCMGNKLGTTWDEMREDLYAPRFGDFVIQANDLSELAGIEYQRVAYINDTRTSDLCGDDFKFNDAIEAFTHTLSDIYPTAIETVGSTANLICCKKREEHIPKGIVEPNVLIPVFPGTTCEYDIKRAFDRVGAKTELFIIRNRTKEDLYESIDAFSKKLLSSQILALPSGFSFSSSADGAAKYVTSFFKSPKIVASLYEMLKHNDGLALGIGNGFQAFVKMGLIPYGEIVEPKEGSPTFVTNNLLRHVSTISRIRVATNKTPWFNGISINSVFNVPISNLEGKFVASAKELGDIVKNGLIATQYIDDLGKATMAAPFNPVGSLFGIEGLISPDGRILGKMGHVERYDEDLYKNIEGNFNMNIFKSGVDYFK